MEEREKLAQLGELITDLSREFKDIYAERRPEVGRSLCQEAIAALPQVAQFGPEFSSIFLQDMDLADDVELDTLPLPKTDAVSLGILRAMRLQLATTAFSGSEKSVLWQSLQTLSLSELILYDRITSLASAHMHLLDQSAKARLLMDGILEFHQRRGTQRLCRVDHTMQKIQSLLGPRLRVTGVRLDMVISEDTLLIHPADLMQVGIGLITTLCHRLEMLLDQDKWLKIRAESRDDMLLLRFTCGGPKLTEVQALHLFDPATEGNEASTPSNGLHVARRIVQRAPGRLDFNLGESTSCFELELPKAVKDSP